MLFSSPSLFAIEPYTLQLSCEETSCTFTGRVVAVRDKNSTVFYTLERAATVEAVFFVGSVAPTFAVGDCVVARGTAQTFKGKQSIVLQMLQRCAINGT